MGSLIKTRSAVTLTMGQLEDSVVGPSKLSVNCAFPGYNPKDAHLQCQKAVSMIWLVHVTKSYVRKGKSATTIIFLATKCQA